MSMNEELQSTNEELESSKEELQVLTEELTNVNAELERKVEELATANSDMQNLLNSSQIIAVFLDRKLRVRRFTPAATEIFPRIGSELDRPFHQISCTVENPQVKSDAEKVLKTPGIIEREVKTSAGHWYIQRILPYRTEKDVIDGVVITLIEITERKKAFKEQALLAAIVESSNDAIIGKTLDGIVTSWNPGAERMYGYAPEEVIGRPISFLAPPEKKAEIKEILKKLRRGERIIDFETERATKEGRRIDVSLTISPIIDAEGKVVGASTNARDITLSLQAREALRQAKEAAEEANRAKSEFLANVSHEIRTPMTVTLSALAQLLTGVLTEEQRKYLEMAQTASRSLLNLIDEILDFSRIEARALELAREPFDLHQCVQETVNAFSLMAEEKGLKLSHEVDPGVPRIVIGDPQRLRQVLTNLVSNAVKFTEEGEVSVVVNPSRTSPNDPDEHLLLISVRDTGIGFAKRDLPRLFRTFSQLDSSRVRRFGGVGLGLAIARRLVELMDGELRVESKKGEGSLFSFCLPLVPHEEALPLQGPAARIGKSAETRQQLARILLVEDEPQISEMVSGLLSKHGWETETVADGFKAIEAWGTGRFDLILMDLQMPMLDGLEVTRAIRIKEKQKGNHIPIIALTAHALEADRKACQEAGMDGFLAKPVESDDLFTLIERHLAEKEKGPGSGAEA
jgi:PAS domain S-box-containing protein